MLFRIGKENCTFFFKQKNWLTFCLPYIIQTQFPSSIPPPLFQSSSSPCPSLNFHQYNQVVVRASRRNLITSLGETALQWTHFLAGMCCPATLQQPQDNPPYSSLKKHIPLERKTERKERQRKKRMKADSQTTGHEKCFVNLTCWHWWRIRIWKQ